MFASEKPTVSIIIKNWDINKIVPQELKYIDTDKYCISLATVSSAALFP